METYPHPNHFSVKLDPFPSTLNTDACFYKMSVSNYSAVCWKIPEDCSVNNFCWEKLKTLKLNVLV
jgi:hypothetical protein